MRKFKENLILRCAENYMMINLVSFRRKIISNDQYELLKCINSKDASNLTKRESMFLSCLIQEKQVLSEEIITAYDNERKVSYNRPCFHVGSITINLTYDCNFKCTYCYQKKFSKQSNALSINDIDRIHDYISTYNNRHGNMDKLKEVVISGGESLLDCNVETINRILTTFDSEKFKMFTNGVNILKYADKIDYSKFSEVQVSLDGTNEIIKSVNKNNTCPFDKVVDGIRFLIGKGVKVTVISMVTKETIEKIQDFLGALKERNLINHDGVSIRFSFVIDYGEPYTLDPTFYTFEEYLSIRRQVIEAVKNISNISVDRVYDLNYLADIIYRGQNIRRQGRIAMCRTLEGFPLLFGPNRRIYWCTCIDMSQPLANLDDDPMELDKNPVLLEFLNRNVYQIEKCSHCFYRFVCSSGCPLYALHSNKSPFSPHCGIFGHPIFEEQAEKFLGV